MTPTRIPQEHVAAESLLARTSKWWTCSDEKLSQFGDIAFAVQANTVAGVYGIAGWRRDDSTGKVELFLEGLPDDHPARGWLDQPAPVPWKPGQRQPFKYVSRKGLLPTPPTDVVQVNARQTIAHMARAASATLAKIPNGVKPPFKVVRAYEIYHTVYSLLDTGTVLPGGPRLLQHVERFPHEISVLDRELARLAGQTSSSGYAVTPSEAERCVQVVSGALQKLARLMATPSSGAEGLEYSVGSDASKIRTLNRHRFGSRDASIRADNRLQRFREDLQDWVDVNIQNYPDITALSRAARAEARVIVDDLRIGMSDDELYRQVVRITRQVWDHYHAPLFTETDVTERPQVPRDD